MKLYAFLLTWCFCLKHNSAKNSIMECYKIFATLQQCIAIPFIFSSHESFSRFIQIHWKVICSWRICKSEGYQGKAFMTYMWVLNKTLLGYWITAFGEWPGIQKVKIAGQISKNAFLYTHAHSPPKIAFVSNKSFLYAGLNRNLFVENKQIIF